MLILSPSLLSVDFNNIAENMQAVRNAGAGYIHLDVMDGVFVPNISFGPPVIKCIRQNSDSIFDVHLMVNEPYRYIDDYKNCGADIITVHAEACTHLNRTIMRIKEMGMKACVALNPSTPLSVLDYILPELDMVLIMSVNPGFSGQTFIPYSLQKISDLKKIITDRGLCTDIQVDGGVNINNVSDVIEAGANVIVAGSAIFNGNPYENVKAFIEKFEKYQN